MSALAAESVAQLARLGVLSPLDVHLAAALSRMADEPDERVRLAVAMVSRQLRHGHVCLDVAALCGSQLVLDLDDGVVALRWPEPATWLAAIGHSSLVDGPASPLVLDGGRLYLRRYFDHEVKLAGALERRAQKQAGPVDRRLLEQGLDRLFGASTAGASSAPRRRRGKAVARDQLSLFGEDAGVDEPDMQRVAAQRAVERALCVVSGGPGTGKTATVVKMLGLLVEQALGRGGAPPRVHLMAPTGKAAARLSESIARAKRQLDCSDAVREAIPEQATTIHRALGSMRGTRRFRHDARSPLATDAVVVDEASMVDLALMARLLAAVPDDARLILLGDKDQLSSVEAGAVLGDICGVGASRSAGAIGRAVVQLTRSYRYRADSAVAGLARAVLQGDADQTLALLQDDAVPEVQLIDAPLAPGLLHPALERELVAGLGAFFDAQGAAARLAALDGFRVLCAHRHGPEGLTTLNARIEAALRRRGVIHEHGERYVGRPVLITQNDYQAGLFNGDVGVLLPDERRPDRVVACFSGTGGEIVRISPARLPPHESVFAMSIHKSQGSEFDTVAIVLPAEPSPVLSRELLYTAVTRARRRVVIFARRAIVGLTVRTGIARASGLADRLWGARL